MNSSHLNAGIAMDTNIFPGIAKRRPRKRWRYRKVINGHRFRK